MRFFVTCTDDECREILSNGFTDRLNFGDFKSLGVYVGKTPNYLPSGLPGKITLYLDLPAHVFGEHEEIEDDTNGWGEVRTGRALIPSTTLNQFEKPQIYVREFAGRPRREIRKDIVRSPIGKSSKMHNSREAIDAFDEHGWLTPVKIQEKRKI